MGELHLKEKIIKISYCFFLILQVGCLGKVDVSLPVASNLNSAGGSAKPVFSCDPYLASADHAEVGLGTSEDPFKICSAAQFASIGQNASDWNKHYIIMKDIDMTGYDETNLTLIGNLTNPFRGVLDGNNKTISNFTYEDASADYIGIIGVAFGSNTAIRNLTATNVTILGDEEIGAIVGRITYGVISNVSSSGTITGDRYKGGIIGNSMNGTQISGSSSSVNLVSNGSNDSFTGGLIGRVTDSGRIENCFATGDLGSVGTPLLSGHHGGLIGRSTDSIVLNSFSTGNIYSSAGLVGGVIGEPGGTSVLINSFATGNVRL